MFTREMAFPEFQPYSKETSEIAERAENHLRRNGYFALKNISCEYSEGVLTLTGWLPTYYLKQVAQTTVACLEGVERIENRIEVVPPETRPVCPV